MVSYTNDFVRLQHEFSELCDSGELDYMPMKLKSIIAEMILILEEHDKKIHEFYHYKQPDYCNCVFSINRDDAPCGKCGTVAPFVYWSLCGFPLAKPVCPKCHDAADDCEPVGET